MAESETKLISKLKEHNLSGLVPDMRPEEWLAFYDDVAERGVIDPLVILKDGTILDGRHRFRAARELGLSRVPVRYADLNGTAPEDYMIKAALLRRHLTDDQRAVLARKWLRERIKHQGERTDLDFRDTVSQKSEHPRKEAANKFATSERKIKYAAQVESIAPELLDDIAAGEITMRDALKVVNERKREEKIAGIVADNAPLSDATGPFNILYVDPPWRYEHVKTESRAIENQYPTMALEDICALKVSDICADDCVLFMWATSPKLHEAMQVLDAWGFSYRTCMVWVKDKIGMGYYVRQQHELLLIAARGELPVPKASDRQSSVVEAPRTEHSAKPEAFYEVIEAMYPEYGKRNKVELFARNARKGWSSWGNQAK